LAFNELKVPAGNAIERIDQRRDRENEFPMFLDAKQYDLIIRTFEGKNYRQMEYNPGIWNGLGIAYYKTGNFEKAIELYEKVLPYNKDSPAFFTNFGEALFSHAVKKKDKTMLQNFQTAVKLDPEYARLM